jgi:hypothetical protein
MDIYKSRERGREDVSINTGNIEALALSGDKERPFFGAESDL